MAFNGVSNGTLAYVTGATGFGQALSPASLGYVTMSPVIPTYASGSPVCIEGWLNYTSTASRYAIGMANIWWIQANNGILKLACGLNGNIYMTTTTNDGTWHHFAIQVDIYNYISFYVDGVLIGSQVFNINQSTSVTYIGNATTTVGNGWAGYIDEVVITAGMKYSYNFNVPTAPQANSAPNQVALYHFDGDLTDANTTYSGVVVSAAYRTAIGLTTASVTATAASGGTVPYTYQWQRATDSSGIPGTFTNVAGATSITLNDTGLSNATKYWYRLIVTDNLSATFTTNAVSVTTVDPTAFYIGEIGDSITAGTLITDPTWIAFSPLIQSFLSTYYNGSKKINICNQGIPSMTTANWSPGQTVYINGARAFAAYGIKLISIQLGTNDSNSGNNMSATTFSTNLTSICTALVALGYKVMLDYPTYPNDGRGSTFTNLLESYFPKIDSLVNGTTIFAGDKVSYYTFKANALAHASASQGSYYNSDGLHPNQLGHSILALTRGPLVGLALGIISNSQAIKSAINF
jgi:lysophospholipase L1-like esterase